MKELEEILNKLGLSKNDIVIYVDSDSVSLYLKEYVYTESWEDAQKYEEIQKTLRSWSWCKIDRPEEICILLLRDLGYSAEK